MTKGLSLAYKENSIRYRPIGFCRAGERVITMAAKNGSSVAQTKEPNERA